MTQEKKHTQVPMIAPFQGVRFNPAKIRDLNRVTAPPYDVISEEGQKALYEKDPHNVVRLILGYQYPKDSDADNRYTRAAASYQSWVSNGVLLRDKEPCYYLYDQEFSYPDRGSFSRRGFLALRRVEDLGKGKICPHERTLSAPKADRLLLMKSCHANLSPIFALYSDPKGQVKALLARHFETAPVVDFKDDDGIRHRLWRVRDQDLFAAADDLLGREYLFIADGHHRYETSIAYRDWQAGLHPESPEDASFRYVMMFFSEMSDPGLLILPTHRVLQNREAFNASALEGRLKEWFEVRPLPEDDRLAVESVEKAGKEGLAFGWITGDSQQRRLLVIKDEVLDRVPALASVAPAARRVDTMVLHRVIFQDVLGMKGDEDKDPRYLRFVKDAFETIRSAKEPGVNSVFLLNATPMPVLQKVVEAGMVLPPKTTYFYPKLLTGLVMNQIDTDGRVTIR